MCHRKHHSPKLLKFTENVDMVAGLEVTIKYKGPKYFHVASSSLSHRAEVAILKKDLSYLRVHPPSQKNVRRVDGAFVLRWPTASTGILGSNVPDTLYTRWMRLSGNDPESRSLRATLSIESITLTREQALFSGRPIGPNAGEQHGNGPPPTSPVTTRGSHCAEPFMSPKEPQASAAPLHPPPGEPRRDRERHALKRPLSSGERSPSPVRRKMDETTLQKLNTSMDVLASLNGNLQSHGRSASPHTAAAGALSSSTVEVATGDIQGPETVIWAAQNPDPPKAPQTPEEPAERAKPIMIPPPRVPRKSVSPNIPGSKSSGGRSNSISHASDKESVNRLSREVWDIRRQITALQAREKVVSQELNRLGVRPSPPSSEPKSESRDDIESRLARAEEELRKERAKRLRAERALEDVERECTAPFIVPALYQAFMSISELSD
ncbi:hypothetical protein F5I97DRAFT_1922978 [Phlebopus sp. FC_14]|nr:hypothetical protein F5I97DRAFT_1922978 [Phlebopus sp. FC_14]